MATIGTFSATGEGFVGEINIVQLQARNVRIVRLDRSQNENAPTHRIYLNRAEIGAGWQKRSAEDRDYVSVKIDDPSLNDAIFANLVANDEGEGFSLIWSRPVRQDY